jgi:methyl-accepting chemotaxis protein
LFLKRFVTSSVRNQLLAGFIVVIAAFAVALVLAVSGIPSVSSTVGKGDSAAKLADEVSASARNMAGSQLLVSLGGAKEIANHEGDVASFMSVYKPLRVGATSAADKKALSQVEVALGRWISVNKQIDQLARAGVSPALASLAAGPANEAADGLSEALESYANLRQHEADKASSSSKTSTVALVLVLALAALAAALAVALLLSRGISRRLEGVGDRLRSLDENCLNDLSGGLEAIAGGTLTVGVTAVTTPLQSTRNDEIGQLVVTFNGMLEKTQASIGMYEQMREQLSDALGDRSCLEDLIERMRSLQVNCLTDLQGGLESMAGGDLTVRVEAVTEPLLVEDGRNAGRLAEIFNAMLGSAQSAIAGYGDMRGKLTGMLGEVTQSSQTVSAASQQMASTSEEAGRAVGEIAHAVGDVAAGAERQVTSVESVRTVIEEVALATQQSADHLRETGEAARQASDVARGGIEAAEKASQAMAAVAEATGAANERIRELGEKSERIGGIVATITGIAEQRPTAPWRPSSSAPSAGTAEHLDELVGQFVLTAV